MRLPGIDHGLQLRYRQLAFFDHVFGEIGRIGRGGRIHRRHGGALHQLAGMVLGTGNHQTLRPIRFIDRIGQRTAGFLCRLGFNLYFG